GNVRELKHAVERAIIISTSSQLGVDDFLISSQRPNETTNAALSLAELEKDAIRDAIQRHDGNLTQVAKTLGLGRTTLYRKMEKYELNDAQS
ncbi:MAG: helix-turn-helix domain-containing protein, partial [Pseudohongiella sp.]|nr:helix-turn-helix domain-containing protein [Pseudohongiella sp.]